MPLRLARAATDRIRDIGKRWHNWSEFRECTNDAVTFSQRGPASVAFWIASILDRRIMIHLLAASFRLDLGTISRQDEWCSTGLRFDLASHAHTLAVVGLNDLLRYPSLRLHPERYEVEHRIRFSRLIEIEGHGPPVASESILRNLVIYHFSTYGRVLANLSLCIGRIYARRLRVLSQSES
jgi:hypothetical protein